MGSIETGARTLYNADAQIRTGRHTHTHRERERMNDVDGKQIMQLCYLYVCVAVVWAVRCACIQQSVCRLFDRAPTRNQ